MQHDLQEWIPTLNGIPLPPRRRLLTPIQETQATRQVNEWLDKDVIEEIPTPPYVNNLVLVAKKDGRIRVCVDCTPVNKVTESFDWPLPRLQDVRYRIQGSTWFTRLDLTDAFFRISVPAKERLHTAFTVGGKTYQFKRMPFGLKTAPSIFQRFMDWGLSEYYEWCVWYIDDILITASSLAQLKARERIIRRRLKEMACKVNETKSEANKNTLLFAGLQLYGIGVGPDQKKLAELLAIKPPRTKEETQSALGLVSYLRDFIPLVSHYTAMLYPDRNGLRMNDAQHSAAWTQLMLHIKVAATTTKHWDEGREADLYTDASGFAVGIILIQDARVVAVASRKLSKAEDNYSPTDREHLGLVFAADKFRLFLHRENPVTRVWTDHKSLVERKPDNMTPRQTRWYQKVSDWMPKIAHVRGKYNPADFVSRWGLEEVGANF